MYSPSPSADHFLQGWKYYGLNRGSHEGKDGIWYREWAPAARSLAVIGEFNNWNPAPEHWASKNPFGVFELFLPDNADGSSMLPHRRVGIRGPVIDQQFASAITTP